MAAVLPETTLQTASLQTGSRTPSRPDPRDGATLHSADSIPLLGAATTGTALASPQGYQVEGVLARIPQEGPAFPRDLGSHPQPTPEPLQYHPAAAWCQKEESDITTRLLLMPWGQLRACSAHQLRLFCGQVGDNMVALDCGRDPRLRLRVQDTVSVSRGVLFK